MKKLLLVFALVLGAATSAKATVGDVNSVSYETCVTATGRAVQFEMAYWVYGSCTWTSAYFSASGVIDSYGVVHVAGIPPACYPDYTTVQITVTNSSRSFDVYAAYFPPSYCTYAIMLYAPRSATTAPPTVDPNPQPGTGLPPNDPQPPPTGPGGPA